MTRSSEEELFNAPVGVGAFPNTVEARLPRRGGVLRTAAGTQRGVLVPVLLALAATHIVIVGSQGIYRSSSTFHRYRLPLRTVVKLRYVTGVEMRMNGVGAECT